MNRIVVSYFLILIIIFILTCKYFDEAPIIENFYENEPKISIEDLRVLSKVAHSFVNGEPLKLNYNVMTPQFYIGNKLFSAATINELKNMSADTTGTVAVFEDKSTIEMVNIMAKVPNDIVVQFGFGAPLGVASNPFNLTYIEEQWRSPPKLF